MSASTFRINRMTPGAGSSESDRTARTETGALLVRSLTTTVPKELVHRASVAEVMLTDWEPVGDDRFVVTAQWPRGHSFFAMNGRYNPLIAAETIRQAGILLAHAEYGVPLDQQPLVRDISVSLRPEHFDIDWTPAGLELSVAVHETQWHDGQLTGLRVDVEMRRDGHLAATGGGALTCARPQVDRGAQEERPQAIALTAPLPPQTVGRTSPMDVVLSPIGEPDRWQLRVDTRHSAFLDQQVEHVPDMMLLETACQATAATLERSCVPLEIASEFLRDIALTSPCVIEACLIPGTGMDPVESVLVTGHQDGKLVFRSTVTVAAD
ncbi:MULTISPECIES: ScbA/BarX family gamma-butyrolactone biosynthesis protein [unclassified Streptomyces]|uniref:ScbA/BarX family gamma-butyrolactone biosynthesis protein n=1 Tax=unclassified Streptomyces TaxID=2593676 RepID=UPI0036E5407F